MHTARFREVRWSRPVLQRRPLALCLAAALAAPTVFAAPGPACGNVLTVTSCDDSGPGSLRDTLAAAVSGDTIGFSPDLGCKLITLTSGALVMGQGADGQPLEALSLTGPGRDALTLSGGDSDRVLVHDAGTAGALTVSGLTLSHGVASGDGGCVEAAGSVSLTDVALTHCVADDTANSAGDLHGGGLSASGTATIDDSVISDNQLHASNGYAYGGGVFAAGGITLTASIVSGNAALSDTAPAYGGGFATGDTSARLQGNADVSGSTVSDNSASSTCGVCLVKGGGAFVYGNATFADSVLSGNTASGTAHYAAGGALYFRKRYGGAAVTGSLGDTTVSGNSADSEAGGIAAAGAMTVTRSNITDNHAGTDGGGIDQLSGDLDVESSTIANNTAVYRGGGIMLFGYGDVGVTNSTVSGNSAGTNGGGIANTYGSVHLANGTIANNTAAGHGGGVYFRYAYYTFDMQSTIIAGNQAAGSAEDVWPPNAYITGANDLVVAANGGQLPADTLRDDPMLLPLADNGGPTLTHALDPLSPAIDTGANPHDLEFDQRGSGHARVDGRTADIGAFEFLILAPPGLGKSFTPTSVDAGTPSLLTITLGNANADAAKVGATLVDVFPKGLYVADPAQAATTCLDGDVAAVTGSNQVSLAAGAGIPANGSCTVTVLVTADAQGIYSNVIPAGALQTSVGDSPLPASADLIVTPPAVTDRIFASGFDG
jgi:hypothetical protein